MLDSLFIQSNLGIVTRMGIWLQPTPEAYQTLSLNIERAQDLGAAVDAVRDLMLAGLLRGVPCFYSTPLSGTIIKDLPMEPGFAWSEEQLDEHGRKTGLGRWSVRIALWDDPDVLAAKRAKILEVWSRIPGSSVYEGRVYAPEEYGEITNQSEKVQIGIPHLDLLALFPDFIGHIEVSPVAPMKGDVITQVVEIIQNGLGDEGFLAQIGILAISARSAAVVTGINFDKGSEDQVRAAVGVSHKLVRALGEKGFVPYRTHLDLMDSVAEQMSFNDGAYHRFMTTIKDAVDPGGILSPGRHGVWPSNGPAGRAAR